MLYQGERAAKLDNGRFAFPWTLLHPACAGGAKWAARGRGLFLHPAGMGQRFFLSGSERTARKTDEAQPITVTGRTADARLPKVHQSFGQF